jgi:hypothetical protein
MMPAKRSLLIPALFASLAATVAAKADPLVFSVDQTQVPTSFSAGAGVGQAVSAAQTMTVDGFAFDLDQRGGGNVDYFIYDATTGTYTLAPEAVAVSATNRTWDLLDGFTVTLDAGDVYYFGVYGSNQISVGMDPISTSSLYGLGVPTTAFTSYDFSGDTPTVGLTGTDNGHGMTTNEVGLRVYSIDPPTADTPEPNSLVLMGTGILAAAGAMRRKFLS